jgi:Domain of unknown function (DUF222)
MVSTVTVPASTAQALGMLECAMGFLADADATQMPTEALAHCLRTLERIDAIGAAARGRLLAAFDAQDGHLADGQRSSRAWLTHSLGVTGRQAGEHLAVAGLAREHPRLLGGLRGGDAFTKSVALQLAKWMRAIPAEFRDEAEEIAVTAARSGADLPALARICAEIRRRTAPPDSDDHEDHDKDTDPYRSLSLDTTLDGAGVLHGDLTPQCAAMVRAVLDALSAPQGSADGRTRPQRYHDALAEAMKRLLSANLVPQRAGQPVKALVHIYFAELCQMDANSALQDTWITEYRARWAGHRAAASARPGDGGAWLEGDAARAVACDAMIIPVVTGDIDPGAIEELISLCVEYHRTRTQVPVLVPAPGPALVSAPALASASDGTDSAPAGGGATAHAEALAMLEHQILGKVIQVVSGPGGVASFLRRNLLGKPLGGPSLPLDVGQTDEVPAHLRRLVALRDQGCQFPGGCDQPASGCEPHHVIHRADGGPTSLANLKDYCWWHHHVVLHQLGWRLTVHPDGTSQVRSPAGKIIRSHSPPPRPG